MRRPRSLPIAAVALAACGLAFDDPEPAPPRLRLTDPIACRTIRGFGDYDVIEGDEPALTRDQKLMIYVQPIDHTFERSGEKFRAHLTQDVNIRKKGRKKILWGREKVVEYEGESDSPPVNLFLGTTVGLKGLAPGEYEAEIIVYDRLREGREASATRTLSFRVVPRPAAEGRPR